MQEFHFEMKEHAESSQSYRIKNFVQVGPDRTRWSGSTELNRVIGEARIKYLSHFFPDRPIFMFTVVYGIVYTMRQCY